jgi:2-keto-3-deoxy-6-phosphogluconate aldolase
MVSLEGNYTSYLRGAAMVLEEAISKANEKGITVSCDLNYRNKLLWIPGCGSISEISMAEELGAELVKIFPASQVEGPSFIKAVKGPYLGPI